MAKSHDHNPTSVKTNDMLQNNEVGGDDLLLHERKIVGHIIYIKKIMEERSPKLKRIFLE